MNLAKYDTARAALSDCRSVDEVKEWADRAAATQAYARMAKDKGLEVDAAEIRIRAERRLGEMLSAQKSSGNMAKGHKFAGGTRTEPPAVTLAEIGVDKKLSARAQKIAAVPAEKFEAEVADWRDRVEQEGERVTARLEAAADYTEEDRRREYAADFEAMAKVIDSDDRLSAAMGELRVARKHAATLERLCDDKTRELEQMKREASRWMKKAKKSAACQDCMTALERP